MVSACFIQQKHRCAGAQFDAVIAVAFDQFPLCRTVFLPNRITPMVDVLIELFKRPDEQPGAVRDFMPDPLLTVFDRLFSRGGILLFLRPQLTVSAPDVPPAIIKRYPACGYDVACSDRSITPSVTYCVQLCPISGAMLLISSITTWVYCLALHSITPFCL